jgi:hypothetical protein
MRGYKNIVLLCLLLLAAVPGFAQMSKLSRVNDIYIDYQKTKDAKRLDSAKILIDQVVSDPETSKDFIAWTLRGYIYKDLYRTTESQNPASPLRDESVILLKKALALDTANKNTNKEAVIKGLKWIAASYHNDINKTLDTIRYQQSLTNAEKHKQLMKYLDPAFNEKEYDFKVYSTIGSMFQKAYEHSTTKNNLDLAKVYLFKAYDLNNNSESINKNIGVLYYNQAVDIIKKMDYDIPLDELPVYQDKSVKLAQQGLPYFLKAYKLNTTDKATVEALAGIYYLLNDNEKHNEYKKILEELNKH